MSRVKSKDTTIETRIRSALHRRGLRFRKHVRDLPGRPDIVFRTAKVAVFIDGDFWHGFRFEQWKTTLSPFWQDKIEKNRRRDKKNHELLKESGWRVIRLWQHDIENNIEQCLKKVEQAVSGHEAPNSI